MSADDVAAAHRSSDVGFLKKKYLASKMRWDSISFAHFVLNITGEINISPVFFQ